MNVEFMWAFENRGEILASGVLEELAREGWVSVARAVREVEGVGRSLVFVLGYCICV